MGAGKRTKFCCLIFHGHAREEVLMKNMRYFQRYFKERIPF